MMNSSCPFPPSSQAGLLQRCQICATWDRCDEFVPFTIMDIRTLYFVPKKVHYCYFQKAEAQTESPSGSIESEREIAESRGMTCYDKGKE